MIKVIDLVKNYGNEKVLDKINCTFHNGDLCVLLGPSGAGKSTLMRCINGLVDITDGHVFINDRLLPKHKRELREVRKDVSMIFQQFNLVKRLTVLENVLCGRLAYTGTFLSLMKVFSKRDYELALHYLEKVGLIDKRNQRADQLSGGQQQRVAIARALMQEPKLLLADEPVASLDPKTSNSIMELLSKIHEEEKLTMIITLHQIELAKKFGHRIIGLNGGNIIADLEAQNVAVADLYELYDKTDSIQEEPPENNFAALSA